MTPRQKEYKAEMERFFIHNDQFPPVKHLADAMGVSGNAAAEALERLEMIGIIERNTVNKYKRGPNW